MSGRAQLWIQAVVTVLAVIGVAGAVLWALGDPSTATVEAERAAPADSDPAVAESPSAPPSETASVPTPVPTETPTPAPTPTPRPLPEPFTDLIARPDLATALASPLAECELTGGEATAAGTITIRCIEPWSASEVVSVADGRIVHINRELAVDVASVPPIGWSWASQAALGPHVVVDHTGASESASLQVVYAGLDTVDGELRLGMAIEAGTPLGIVKGPEIELGIGIWDANERHDGAIVVGSGPDEQTQRAAAAAIGERIVSPTDERCPLSLGGGQLPGASRAYRNGTHQGIDFGCGTSDRYGHAIADGTVVYLVDDYDDPSVADREALLALAGHAGYTPHWTLVMLYGNVVVIDHGVVPGAGRVVTIAAHLEQVDSAIELGSQVVAGQVLGELGNRGTNASSLGLRGSADPSLHLHWELFIDDWYLGSGQPPGVVVELIASALCADAATPGCPTLG